MSLVGRGRVRTAILGGGVTGIAAARTSGGTVFEAERTGGGICASYYMFPGESTVYDKKPDTPGWYRFERGGGHWIFGGDPAVLQMFERTAGVKRYSRRSSVRLEDGTFVKFPLQDNLHQVERTIAADILSEVAGASPGGTTMAESHRRRFGNTLSRLFFEPFHELYTAGLYGSIAPQDDYKTPVDLKRMIRGAMTPTEATGYNTTFLYPSEGLDGLVAGLSRDIAIEYGRRCVSIDLKAKELGFDDGGTVGYETLLSTLPLPTALAMAGLRTETTADPHTGVAVLNIGAVKGDRCPDDHWLYVTKSRGGFHRVGFYSNVDEHFVPFDPARPRVGLYIERAVPANTRLTEQELAEYKTETIAQLQEWGMIADVDVCDVSLVDFAYTWQWQGSRWRSEALALAGQHHIGQVGRYARWIFQGIADSVRDGLMVGATVA